MKKLNFIRLLMLVGVLAYTTSCKEEDGRTTYPSEFSYVQFTASTAAVSEVDTTRGIVIEVSNVGPTLDQDISVAYAIDTSSNAVRGTHYALTKGSGQTITIPAGEHFGSITINTLDNDVSDGTKTLTLVLTSASQGLSPGRGQVGKTFTLTISDDDCPLVLDTFVGAFDHSFTHTAGFLWAAGLQEGFVATLSPRDGAPSNVFDCENFFGLIDREGLGSLGSPVLGKVPILIDETAKTAEVWNQYPAGKTGWTFYFSGGTAEREMQAVSAGEVGTCGPTFSLSANLVRTADQSIGTSITQADFSKID